MILTVAFLSASSDWAVIGACLWLTRGLIFLRMNSLLSRITINPEICHGKPVIRGLRYPVESILEYLAAGDSIDDVLREFSDLEREDLLACLEFAKRSLQLRSQHLVLA
jgi:uncharacterized protein (DUF433 family)